MIRPAELQDIPAIVSLGRRFHGQAAWADIVEYVDADVSVTLEHLATQRNGILIVAEEGSKIVGMAGGLVSPLYLNFAHLTGQELFWYCTTPRIGLRLLDAMEQAARDRGCASWAMISLDKIEPDRMRKLYARRGYRPSEHSFIKRL